jgi:hypothetical protein
MSGNRAIFHDGWVAAAQDGIDFCDVFASSVLYLSPAILPRQIQTFPSAPKGFFGLFRSHCAASPETDLAGYYLYDNQCVKARRVDVADNGVLKTFLMSRSPIEGFCTIQWAWTQTGGAEPGGALVCEAGPEEAAH